MSNQPVPAKNELAGQARLLLRARLPVLPHAALDGLRALFLAAPPNQKIRQSLVNPFRKWVPSQ